MAGEVGEVMVQVSNPLPVELRVARMSLISEGVTLDSSSTNLTLPPLSGPCNINLSLTPREEGRLTLRGYCHNVLGVTSECFLSDQMMESGNQSPSVTVISPLPLVTMTVEQRLGIVKYNIVFLPNRFVEIASMAPQSWFDDDNSFHSLDKRAADDAEGQYISCL